MYMRGGGVPGPTTVCVYVWREKELERAVKFTLPPPFYFTARIYFTALYTGQIRNRPLAVRCVILASGT
jgi:hypothetical protein